MNLFYIDILIARRDQLPEEFSVQQATGILKPLINGRSMPTTRQLAQIFRISKKLEVCGLVDEASGTRQVYKFVE